MVTKLLPKQEGKGLEEKLTPLEEFKEKLGKGILFGCIASTIAFMGTMIYAHSKVDLVSEVLTYAEMNDGVYGLSVSDIRELKRRFMEMDERTEFKEEYFNGDIPSNRGNPAIEINTYHDLSGETEVIGVGPWALRESLRKYSSRKMLKEVRATYKYNQEGRTELR